MQQPQQQDPSLENRRNNNAISSEAAAGVQSLDWDIDSNLELRTVHRVTDVAKFVSCISSNNSSAPNRRPFRQQQRPVYSSRTSSLLR